MMEIEVKELKRYYSKHLRFYEKQLAIYLGLDIESYEDLDQRMLIRDDIHKFKKKITYTTSLLGYLDYLERLETYGNS